MKHPAPDDTFTRVDGPRHDPVLRYLSRALLLMVLVAAGTGLLWGGGESITYVTHRGETVTTYGQGLYRHDSLLAGAGHRGVDGIVLLLGLPLLALGFRLHRRAHPAGTILLSATLAAILYVYTTLTLGASYNELLLLHAAITATSALSLALVIPRIDSHGLLERQRPRHTGLLGSFLVTVAILTSVVWLILVLEPIFADTPPRLGGATTYFTPALDFAFIIPALALAGTLLRRRDARGYALAIPLLGILAFVGPAMIGQSISQTSAGITLTTQDIVTYIVTFAIMSGGGILGLASLLRLAARPRMQPSKPKMESGSRTRTPRSVTVLLGLLLFQAVSALGGGSVLILDPSGELGGLPLSLLTGTPFASYLVPGSILFFVLGVFPLITAYGVWRRPSLGRASGLERTFGKHWSWLASLTIGFALMIWIVVQILMLGVFGHPLQIVYVSLGVIIVSVTLSPGVQRHLRARSTRGRAVTVRPGA